MVLITASCSLYRTPFGSGHRLERPSSSAHIRYANIGVRIRESQSSQGKGSIAPLKAEEHDFVGRLVYGAQHAAFRFQCGGVRSRVSRSPLCLRSSRRANSSSLLRRSPTSPTGCRAIPSSAIRPISPFLSPRRPPRGSEARPGDVIRDLEIRRSWLTLLNIEQHPGYRSLMDACLDEVAEVVQRRPGDMRRRVGFIFVSSPLSVTPAHLDIEHTLLLQVSGHKDLKVGRFPTAAVEQRERERYWEGSHGRVQELPLTDSTYDMVPGRGVYIPPIGPHWVRNSDAVTLSMTLTFFSADSERDQFVEAFNAHLRKLRLRPRPPGSSRSLDGSKATAMRVWGLRRRLIGQRDAKARS